MIKFGIDKLDDIVCQDRKVYILQKGRKGTGYPNFELRFCEYGLLKNLLEENIPCGVIHLSYGDTFQNMYQRYDGWKAEYSLNPNYKSEEFDNFDTQASRHIIQYPLYEFKIYNNNRSTILEYINNFLVGKVKYVFVTNLHIDDSQDIDIIKSIFEIANKTDITFVLRTAWYREQLPKYIEDCIIEFNKNKETQEVVATCLDNNGNLINSKPMIHYKNDGIGYIR